MDKAGAKPKLAWVKAEIDAELQGRATDAAEKRWRRPSTRPTRPRGPRA